MRRCNICHGSEFTSGPAGRLTPSGVEPRCARCGALERHRALRRTFECVPRELLDWRRALQFAPDASLDADWFHALEQSRFGGANSIDLRDRIDRPDGAYDFISLSSVLEFVSDDRAAFAELARVGSRECIIHVTFLPVAGQTRHFSEPHGQYGRYHLYGDDVAEWLRARALGFAVTVTISVADPVTGIESLFHFFCRRTEDATALADSVEAALPQARVVC